MKKLATVLASAVLLSVCATTASAATISSTEILKGTPTIDGYYDEIYGQSSYYEYEDSDIGAVYSTYDFTPDHTARVNFLWDDNYFYMFVTVKDTDVVSRGQEYIDENTTSAWANDAVECWFYADDEYICKVHSDAYGLNFFEHAEGNFGTPADLFDISASTSKVMATDVGYTVEVALKFASDYTDCLKAGNTIGFSLQINDITDSSGEQIYCSGTQDPTQNVFTFSDTEVVLPVVEDVVEEGADEGVAEDAPVSAPTTADIGIVAASLLMVAAAGVALSKKN